MIQVTFREPTEADLDALAANMREMDKLECRVAGGHAPREALTLGVEHSLWTYVAEVEGQVVCAFGVAADGLLGEEGRPWMLCAEGIERHARAILICSRRFLRDMQTSFETLANVVHADNRSAIRYLKWCGFSLGEAFDFQGERFVPFEMKRAA